MDAPRRHQFRARRVRLALPVMLTFTGSVKPVHARSVNISETGMLVRTGEDHAPGTALRFDVDRRVGGRGEVAWSRADADGSILMGLALPRERYALLQILDEHRF